MGVLRVDVHIGCILVDADPANKLCVDVRVVELLGLLQFIVKMHAIFFKFLVLVHFTL